MNEHNVNDFKRAIAFLPSEEPEIDKYLGLKGPDRYFEVLEALQKRGWEREPKWQDVSAFYRYDKRICVLLFRYFSMFEELLRAQLAKKKPKVLSKPQEEKLRCYNEKIKALNEGRLPESDYECFEWSFFSFLIKMYLLLPELVTEPWEHTLVANSNVLIDLRNRVVHGRFLFDMNFGGKTLQEAIQIFGDSLPKGFAYGDGNHPGFFSELRACGYGFENLGRLLLNAHLGGIESITPRRSVTMFNAGFGDCFLIKDGFSSLVVDCGTNNTAFPSQFALSSNLRSMLIDPPNLLITHFHVDHMNHVGDIVSPCPPSRKYAVVYIRGLTKRDYSFWVKNYQAYLLCLFALTGDIGEFSALLNIPGTLISICQPNGKVRTLAEGSFFSVGGTNCRVLWPARNCLSDCNTKSGQRVKTAAKEFFDGLETIAASEDSSSGLIDDLNSFTGENDPRNFSSLFDNNDEEVPLEGWNGRSREIAGTCERIAKAVLDTPRILDYFVSKAKEMISIGSDLENYLSIIFDSHQSFYFAGDGKRSVVKKTLKKAEGIYQIIKVPHHGTKAYYVDFINYSILGTTVYLIPNSLGYKGRTIDPRYTKGRCECLNNVPGYSACPNAATCHKGARSIIGYETFPY